MQTRAIEMVMFALAMLVMLEYLSKGDEQVVGEYMILVVRGRPLGL